MFTPRWRAVAVRRTALDPPPSWHCLAAPAARLTGFVLIAGYVELLVGQGHSMPVAVATAVLVAVGASATDRGRAAVAGGLV